MIDFLLVTIPATLVALAYNIMCASAGCLVASAILGSGWRDRIRSRLSVVVVCTVTGQAVLGATWQTLAAISLFVWPLFVVVGLAALVGAAVVWRRNGMRPPPLRVASLHSVPLPVALLLIPMAFVAISTWVQSFGVPGSDAMAFYLSQPRWIAFTGNFDPLPSYVNFAELGLFVEMNVSAMYLVAGELAARAWLWQGGLVLALGVAALCSELRLPTGTGVLGAMLVLSSSSVLLIMVDGKTDHVSAAWAVGALVVASSVSWGTDWRKFLFIGLLGGFSVLAKVSFLVGLPVALAIIVLERIVATRPDRQWSPLISRVFFVGTLAAGGLVIAFATLAFKNSLVFGEPLAPFFYLGGGSGSMLNQAWYTRENTQWILLTYPFALTLGQYPMQHGGISPFLLGLAPIVALGWRNANPNRLTVVLAIAGLVGVLLWILLRPSVLAPRYILPSLLCFAPLVAAGAAGWLTSKPRALFTWVVVFAIFGHLILSGLRGTANWTATQAYAAGPKIDGWTYAGTLLNQAPVGSRFFINSYFTSFLPYRVIGCALANGSPEMDVVRQASSVEEMWERLYALGISDIFMFKGSHPLIVGFEPDASLAPDWLDVEQIDIGEVLAVIRLRPIAGAPGPAPACTWSR